MISLSITAGTTTASTAIPFTQDFNSNKSTLNYKNNSVQILTPGIYEIVGEATITSTASGNTGITIYGDGEAIGSNLIFYASGASETNTIPIYTVLQIANSSSSDYATITLMPVNAPTMVSGDFSIKRIS